MQARKGDAVGFPLPASAVDLIVPRPSPADDTRHYLSRNATCRRDISVMRRAKLAMLLPVATLFAIAAPAAAAQARIAAAPAAAPAQAATTYTCFPGTPFAFGISAGTVVNKQVTTTLADGTPIPGGFVAHSDPPYYAQKISGPLVDSFTNETTQKTIIRNDTGSTYYTYDRRPKVPGALATGTFVATGNSAQEFGPQSEAALRAAGIHEPTLVFTSGVLVMHFVVGQSGAYVTSFSLRGTQQNGCARLLGRP